MIEEKPDTSKAVERYSMRVQAKVPDGSNIKCLTYLQDVQRHS